MLSNFSTTMPRLRVCTYNCNKLSAVFQYPPQDKSLQGVLQQLGAGDDRLALSGWHAVHAMPLWHVRLTTDLVLCDADIVCFQETKVSSAELWPLAFERIASTPGWWVDCRWCGWAQSPASCTHASVKCDVGAIYLQPPPTSCCWQFHAAVPDKDLAQVPSGGSMGWLVPASTGSRWEPKQA